MSRRRNNQGAEQQQNVAPNPLEVPPDILAGILADLNDLRNRNHQLENQLVALNQVNDVREGERRLAETVVDFNPFSQEIAQTVVPDNLKTLVLDPYFGDSDPKDHLVYFNTKMVIIRRR